jgi:hypothetical protein
MTNDISATALSIIEENAEIVSDALEFDDVDHPKHYNSHPSGIEPITVARYLSGDWFNVFKYVFRADLKDGLKDVRKAIWYAKDSMANNLPMLSPYWKNPQDQLVAQIIEHETDPHRIAFFTAIRRGQQVSALTALHLIESNWPVDD